MTKTPEERRELARKGGKASQAKGTGHRFTQDEAREAGRKGGAAKRRAAEAAKETDQ